MIKKRSIVVILFMIVWSGLIQAQNSMNSSGSDATGNGITVNYSIGQVFFVSDFGSNGSVSPGVQHPIKVVTTSTNINPLSISGTIYPNPTAEHLTLQFDDFNKTKLSYQLIDRNGYLLQNGSLEQQQTTIDLSRLPAAIYFIRVLDQNSLSIQSFKIIKK